MNKRVTTVIDALSGYFESLADYLEHIDPTKYTALKKLFEKAKESGTRMSRVGFATDEARFESVHLYAGVVSTLRELYEQLDFRLPISDEISKTRGYRLTEVFEKITAMYRMYVRDISGLFDEYLDSAHIDTTDPKQLQTLWRKYPNAVDLYTRELRRALDATFRERRSADAAAIGAQIEADKQYSLGEQSHLVPYLSFNCVPASEPMSWTAAMTALGHSSKQRPEDFSSGEVGFAAIERITPGNQLYRLPVAVGGQSGITADDVHPTLVAIEGAGRRWHWSIKVHTPAQKDKITTWIIAERLADDLWRLLTPHKFGTPTTRPDAVTAKIATAAFGRPPAYYTTIDSHIRLQTRVANIIVEKARPTEIGLNALRTTAALMDHLKTLKGSPVDRLESDTLDDEVARVVMEELSELDMPEDEPLVPDMILYWTEWAAREFRKDLNGRTRGLPDTWDASSEQAVEATINKVVGNMYKKDSNAFQDLLDKSHKLREIQMHTV